MGNEENKIGLKEVREAFRAESEGLLAKLGNKPESEADPAPGDDVRLSQDDEEKAAMRAPVLGGVVDGLDGVRVPVLNLALPIGSALVGGVTGMVVGDVIDIVLPPPLNSQGRPTLNLSSKSLINVAAQAAGAGAVLKWGPGLMGGGPARFAAGVMALRVVLRIPAVTNLIDSLGNAIATPLAGVIPAGVSGAQAGQANARQDILAQAEQVIYGEDYFKAAL